MAIKSLQPNTWLELQGALFDEHLPVSPNSFHSGYIHRGMKDSTWKMQSSIERLNMFEQEHHLLRNFQKYARNVQVQRERPWDWLAIAQHHGLPTRLMDWTYNPLVALHFALADADWPEASVVWSLDYVKLTKHLPISLSEALVGGATAFTTDMLDNVAAPISPADGQEVDSAYLLIIEPPSLDDRIVNQYAGLSAFSSVKINVEDWLRQLPEVVAVKIEIPPSLKWEAREKLDKAGINERMIYPGLGGLATWLTRYYSSPPRQWV
ncbi:FRG domain-containing protein [Microbacterium hydrothermale]|uniref:FRG domain-containing protein n=1 Tax=Microbacterium hydrothermale TaxID=857427 RepID=UPI0022260391|nr:FRG domain-containing protein [Microbacterium hydrothermale]MCW2162879.1 FRG domain-containing protein [Microbacterium hydrothermale]